MDRDLIDSDVIHVRERERGSELKGDESLAETQWFGRIEEELSSDSISARRDKAFQSHEKIYETDETMDVHEDELEEKMDFPESSKLSPQRIRKHDPTSLIRRLESGVKPKISAAEMHSRTERLFRKLPENIEKRAHAQNLHEAERRRQLMKQFDDRTRHELFTRAQNRPRYWHT
jgi:hypothetical protein